MSSHQDQALEIFNNNYNCSQAVLAAFAPAMGLDPILALRVAEAFGAGIAHRADMCGAVSGALMVVGLAHSQVTGENYLDNSKTQLKLRAKAKKKTYALAQKFQQAFCQRHGSLFCRELLDCDISTSLGMKRALDQKLFVEKCPLLVADAVAILEDLLTAR